MILLLALCLAPLLIKSMELPENIPSEFSDSFFSLVPPELVYGNIFEHATASSLVALSMASKEFNKLAEAVLYRRCSEDLVAVFEEQDEIFKNKDENICSPENFLRKVWPTCTCLANSFMLNKTLQRVFRVLQGIRRPQKGHHSFFDSYPEVNKVILRWKLPSKISMTTKVPWKYISDFVDDDLQNIYASHIKECVLTCFTRKRYDLITEILEDKRLGAKLEKYMPFSLKFTRHFISTESFEKTLEHFGGPEEFPNHWKHWNDYCFLDFNLPFDVLVNLLYSIHRHMCRRSEPLDTEVYIARFVTNGYKADLEWFNNPKLVNLERMDYIKQCISNGDFKALKYDMIKNAVLYSVLRNGIEGKTLEDLDVECRAIIGDRYFEVSGCLRAIFREFWTDPPQEGSSIFKKQIKSMYDRYEAEEIKFEEMVLFMKKKLSAFIEIAPEDVDFEKFKKRLISAHGYAMLKYIVESDTANRYLTLYLSKEPTPHLLALASKTEELNFEEKLFIDLIRTLAKEEGGVQTLRSYGIPPFPVIFSTKGSESPEETLEKMLDGQNPKLAIFIDYFLFTDQSLFKLRFAENWPKRGRLRLDIALTKATSLYPAELQIKSLRTIGLDKENLLSMYMVRALMSTPEGKVMAQGFVTEKDYEAAITICNGVAPYFKF